MADAPSAPEGRTPAKATRRSGGGPAQWTEVRPRGYPLRGGGVYDGKGSAKAVFTHIRWFDF